MTLPFVNDRDQRKFTCFVCGVLFSEYLEYKEHIASTHEEGREYITCPDCQAPIRDLPLHYKAKHPHRTMPKNCQTRVGVWNDFTQGGKKTRKPGFRQGYFVSNKMKTNLKYRSGYECEVYELLENDNDCVAYFAEPFNIDYYYRGKWKKYIPDIRIEWRNGKTEIWEIKPATQTDLNQNKAKWTAMQEHADNMNWDFTVITEVGINKLKQKVKQQNQ